MSPFHKGGVRATACRLIEADTEAPKCPQSRSRRYPILFPSFNRNSNCRINGVERDLGSD